MLDEGTRVFEEAQRQVELGRVAVTLHLSTDVDHLIDRQPLVAAHVVALPERAWLVQHARQVVDQIVDGDVAVRLPLAAAQLHRHRLSREPHLQIELQPTNADDLTRSRQ